VAFAHVYCLTDLYARTWALRSLKAATVKRSYNRLAMHFVGLSGEAGWKAPALASADASVPYLLLIWEIRMATGQQLLEYWTRDERKVMQLATCDSYCWQGRYCSSLLHAIGIVSAS
jgi:hypothetical protein